MADAKKSSRKKKKKDGQEDKIDKDETAVAKHLRWNFPVKKSSLYGEQVEYFLGAKAVDFLLESKWAKGKMPKSKVQFSDRDSVANFLDRLLVFGLFNRVQRVKKEPPKKTESAKSKPDGSPKEIRKRKPEKQAESEKKDESKDGKKKRKVKYTLLPHDDQIFVDEDEPFVWVYDPVHPKSLFMGILLVLGIIACCLFPLWPDSVRVYSWYISVVMAVGIGALFAVGLLRYVVFALVWVCTFGKLSFWFLPNLTAECGFFDSFKPGYEYEYRGGTSDPQSSENNDNDKDQTKSDDSMAQSPSQEEEEEKDSLDSIDADDDPSWVNVKRTELGQGEGEPKQC